MNTKRRQRDLGPLRWAIFIAVAVLSRPLQADVVGKMYIDGRESQTMTAGQPTEMIIQYDDQNGHPLHHFMLMHEKLNHLLIASQDLSTLKHLHPEYLGGHSGLFGIRINDASTDPDNQDASDTVLVPGKYLVFTEIMPDGEGMTTVPFDLVAVSNLAPATTPIPLVEDPQIEPGLIRKYFGGDGSPSPASVRYQVDLRMETLPHHSSYIVFFDLHVRALDELTGRYEDVNDLELWLGRYAHGVLVTDQGTLAAEKAIRHIHAESDQPGPDIAMSLEEHDGGPIPEGLSRLWIQVKRGGKVQTFPFAVRIKPPPPEAVPFGFLGGFWPF